MGRFISDERVPVSLDSDPENIIYIRPKMNVGVTSKVQSAMVSISAQASVTGKMPDSTSLKFDIGAYNLALLIHNIVWWAGPDFNPIPCNAENIERLDPDDPLVDKVLQEINHRNNKELGKPSPNSSNGNGTTALTHGNGRKRQAESPVATPA